LRAPFPSRFIRHIVRSVLKSEKKPSHLEVNVIFVDNKQIRALSKRFLRADHETDVIAFPYEKGPFGDIFVSLPMARYNAARFGETYKSEVLRLIVHGLLHLLGYSDHGKKEKKIMWDRQEKLVRRLR